MNREFLTDQAHFRQIEGESLPIFTRKFEDLTLFYAPGYLAAAREAEAAGILGFLSGELPFGENTAGTVIPGTVTLDLIQSAQTAETAWHTFHTPENNKPVCLTLYTSLGCSLHCTYCFAEPERNSSLQLSREQIMNAAKDILANCREEQKSFTLVFHGGGEPTMDPRLPELLAALKALSLREQVPFYSYLATNGVMPEETAILLAKSFNQIGLSVDGPPDIQNRQRPLRGGGETAAIVERTARIIRDIQENLAVRVTVLPENYSRIPEIVSYCREVLHADTIRMEPAYHQTADLSEADEFCEYFLKAKDRTPSLSFSGSRLDEIHGRYCHCFRQVLQLVPPEGRSACFAVSSQAEAERRGLHIPFDGEMIEKLSAEDPECLSCFNRFHCSRGCPDICPAQSSEMQDFGSFRCRVNRTLAEAELLRMARVWLLDYAREYGFAGVRMKEEDAIIEETDEREIALFDAFSGEMADL